MVFRNFGVVGVWDGGRGVFQYHVACPFNFHRESLVLGLGCRVLSGLCRFQSFAGIMAISVGDS